MGAPHNGADLIFSSRSGLKIPNFQWPQTGEWHAWESYLYALVWLRLTVIEHQLMTVGTNFNDIWDEEKFPGRCAEGSTAREMIENLVKTVEDRMSDGRVSIEEIDASIGW